MPLVRFRSMRSVWQSTREWVGAVATAWFAWSIALMTGLVDAAHVVFPGFSAPRVALIAGYGLAFVFANVKAFHGLRLRALRAEVQIAQVDDGTQRPTAVSFPDSGDVGEPTTTATLTDDQRDSLRRLGLVNELVSRYQISNFAPPLRHDEKGCVIRIVVAANHHAGASELTSDLKAAFTNALKASTLERWLLGVTTGAGRQDGSIGSWVAVSPNTGYITTRAREPVGVAGFAGSLLSAKATLQMATGLRARPTILLIIDLIEQANPSQPNDPRLRISLADLYALLHDLARTGIDQIADALFPAVLGRHAGLIGPNFEISFGDRSVESVVVIPDSFERPADAQSVPWANINTPEDRDARDMATRDEILRQGLSSILRQNEFDGFEPEISRLQHPESSLAPRG